MRKIYRLTITASSEDEVREYAMKMADDVISIDEINRIYEVIILKLKCEGNQYNSKLANCDIFEVSKSWRFCPNCGITWEKDSVPFGCWSCGYDSHIC